MIFGDIRGHASVEAAIVGGAADIVRLAKSDIGLVHEAMARSGPIPPAVRNRSALPFAGAVSCIDDVQELAHQVNASVGRCNDSLLNASRLLSDKEIMYRLLQAQGVHVPPRVVARDLDELERILGSVKGSLHDYIIKPVVGTESRGVVRPSPGDTPARVVSSLRRLADLAGTEPMIVMPYVAARGGATREYCLDGVVSGHSVRFCALHEKTRIYESYPIHDRAMVTPPRQALDPGMVSDLLERFARAFPVDSFVFHMEARLDDADRLVPIDLSLRPGGGLIFRSVMETYGIDLRLAHMYCCLGLNGELQRLAAAGRKSERFTAIAAVFNVDQPAEVLRAQLAKIMGETDGTSRLVTYDMSNVSILSAASQGIKPNVGLCVTSTRSSSDAVAGVDEIVRRVSMSLTSRLESEPVAGEARVDPPPGLLIHASFSAQAARTPGAVALAQAGSRMTYRELDERSTVMARHLAAAGARVETRIGIHLERSFDAVVAILAALKCGGCYVPLDVSHPRPRMEHILQDAGVEIVVSTSQAASRLPSFGGAVLLVDELAGEAPPIAPSVVPENLAYVVYTSGSTGAPKGVAVCHGAVTNLVLGQSYVDFDRVGCMLQAAPLSFDAATFELWGALLHGKRCVLLEGARPTIEQLRATIESEGVDTAWFTSSLFNTIVEDGPGLIGRLQRVVTGGEPVSPRHVQRAREAHPHTQIINGYGPTETTTFACTHACVDGSTERETVPIGRAIRNVDALVLDAALNPVAHGQVGELFIGGAGLARGYIGRPALTAERFIPHPRATRPGERLYRTGDRVRLHAGGDLEFVGRMDRQVKVRGFRIELDEVEHAILRLPGVQAASVSVDGEGADKLLVASVVPGAPEDGAPTPDGLRAALAGLVPDFMIPNRVRIVDQLAVTPAGKLARSSPAPVADSAVDAGVTSIWKEVLGLTRLEIDDDFFDRGGHSLSATRVVARLRNRFGLDVGMRVLFEHSRLGDFTAYVRARLDERAAPLPVVPRRTPSQRSRGGRLPLSFAQQRLWFLNQLFNGEDASYNVPIALRLRGSLDVEALTSALNAIVARHDVLRATFQIEDEQPVQTIAPFMPLAIEVLEPPPEQIAQHVAAHARHVFDLARGPLLHARILTASPDDHVLLLNMHHIVADGWSMGILVYELSRLYRSAVLGEAEPLPPPALQYVDYAEWQRDALDSEATARQIDYWIRQLDGAPGLLQLPADRPRPERMTGRGAQARFVIPQDVRDALTKLAAREGVTLFMTLMATFMVLLHRISGQRDLVVGTPVAGRTRAELERIIGCFVNTVVLRSRLDGDDSFAAHLRRVSATAMGAYEHQDVPFEHLVERLKPSRSLSYTPVFQVMLALQNIPIGDFDLPGLTIEPFPQNLTTAKFDLNLSLSERQAGISGVLEYNTDIFDAETAERLVKSFVALLRDVASGDVGRPISALDMVGDVVVSPAPAPPAVDEAVVEHWLRLLESDRPASDFPREVPVHRAGPEAGPARVAVAAPAEAAARVRDLARVEGVPAEHVLLASFVVLLQRLTQQGEFLVAVLARGRWSALALDAGGDPSFRTVIERVRRAAEAAEAFALSPEAMEDLFRPSGGADAPLFSASFSDGAAGAPGGWVSPLHLAADCTTGGVGGGFHFDEAALAPSNVERFSRMFERLLDQLLAAPDRAVSRPSLLSEADRQRILHGLNPARLEAVPERSFAEPFEACARRHPDAVALIAGDLRISYRVLDEDSNRLAHYLRSRGIAEGGRVAVVMRRGVAMVVGVYAVAKAGAAYVPVDPEFPAARIALMIREARADCVLVHSETRGAVPPIDVDVVDVDALGADLREQSAEHIPLGQPPSGIAYLMYTSGSTGTPKAVQFPVDAAITSIRWLQAQYPVQEGDHHILKTHLGFDVSIWELFWPLYHGGTLVIADPDGHRDPAYVRALIERHQVRCVNFVPSMLQVFLDELPEGGCSSLRWILSGGEALRPRLRDQCYHQLPGATLVNLYGPTETHSVTDIVVEPDPGSRFVPLGRPSAAYRLYVLDEHLEPMPIGVYGELYIGGDVGLAHGYAGQPALTADRFLPDPYGSPGARMYRSGDLCRYFDSGVLEHLGRADRQVKVRGVRVELSEIESVLNAHQAVGSSAVIAVGEGASRRLVGFVVPADAATLDLDEVERHAAAALPRHMVPAPVLSVPGIPALANGKLDHAALTAIWRAHQEQQRRPGAPAAPLDGTAGRLERIFREVLAQPEIDVDKSFFEIGGHSLLVFRLIAACEREFGVVLPMQAVFTASSVRDLAAEIDAAERRRDLTLIRMSPHAEAREAVALLVHGASGAALAFRHLARRLEADFSVFAFQSPGLEGGGEPPRSVKTNAELYVNAAEQVRGDRPVVLIGWSYGGTVAVEMTRIWRDRGVAVDATILLDSFVLTPRDGPASTLSADDDLGKRLRQIDFLQLEPSPANDGGAQALLQRLNHVLDCNLESFTRYVPERFDGEIHLFCAAGGFPQLTGPLLSDYAARDRNWSRFVERIHTREIDGDHFDLLAERYCDALAAKIRDCRAAEAANARAG